MCVCLHLSKNLSQISNNLVYIPISYFQITLEEVIPPALITIWPGPSVLTWNLQEDSLIPSLVIFSLYQKLSLNGSSLEDDLLYNSVNWVAFRWPSKTLYSVIHWVKYRWKRNKALNISMWQVSNNLAGFRFQYLLQKCLVWKTYLLSELV